MFLCYELYAVMEVSRQMSRLETGFLKSRSRLGLEKNVSVSELRCLGLEKYVSVSESRLTAFCLENK